MRIDFHVHSDSSTRPSQWALQKIGCPESFTAPLRVYEVAKAKGMTHVTITDHNTIDGSLRILHLPDTFISEEVTSYFPEDGCKLHILALNITETQHREIQYVRRSVYDLAGYLSRNAILHIVAHPLYALNGKLTVDHFEKMLLLFQNFELNGSRNKRENDCLSEILNHLRPDDIFRLSAKHHLEPATGMPWCKRLFGGSDDHSGLNIARTYTEILGVDAPGALFTEIDGCSLIVHSSAATPKTMAHNLYGIAYQFYRNKFDLQRYAEKDVLMRFLDRSLRGDIPDTSGVIAKLYYLWNYRKRKKELALDAKAPVSESLVDLLKFETRRLLLDNPGLMSSLNEMNSTSGNVRPDFAEGGWFNFVNEAANRVTVHFGNHLLDHLSGANVFNIFHTIGSAAGLYTLLAPYFIAYTLFSKDKALTEEIYDRFSAGIQSVGSTSDDTVRTADEPAAPNVAHFTDTFFDVNGVARTLQEQVRAAQKTHKRMTVVTCVSQAVLSQQKMPGAGIRNFEPVGAYELPEYPEQKIFYPPLLEMIDFCYENRFTHIHSATPGPVGLAALAIARILRLPFIGTYHTAIPQYAQALTGDSAIEEVAWRFILWYYDQMDIIYAPSESTRAELTEKGIRRDKIVLYPRGIDIDRFHPSRKTGITPHGFSELKGIKLLYVGRISTEKNLHHLSNAFKSLITRYSVFNQPKASLVVVGDGPYLSEMKKQLAGYPCLFTGYVSGEPLSVIYAASDLFVFPSTTDTFGNVVLEAQASGLPVIVTDQGGPCENIEPNVTGIIIPGNDDASLMEAIDSLVQNPRELHRMGLQARRYMEKRSFEGAFVKSWELYHRIPCSTKPSFAMAG
ncbi:MAG: glycosyltransferase [Pseudomonadota bacterium]